MQRVLYGDRKYGSMEFVKIFMVSNTAKALDSRYNRMQWAGEEYLMEEIKKAMPASVESTYRVLDFISQTINSRLNFAISSF